MTWLGFYALHDQQTLGIDVPPSELSPEQLAYMVSVDSSLAPSVCPWVERLVSATHVVAAWVVSSPPPTQLFYQGWSASGCSGRSASLDARPARSSRPPPNPWDLYVSRRTFEAGLLDSQKENRTRQSTMSSWAWSDQNMGVIRVVCQHPMC